MAKARPPIHLQLFKPCNRTTLLEDTVIHLTNSLPLKLLLSHQPKQKEIQLPPKGCNESIL